MLITRLLLVLEVCDGKPTYRKSWAGNFLVWSVLEVCDGKPTFRKSWAGNFLVWSDFTLGPSFEGILNSLPGF